MIILSSSYGNHSNRLFQLIHFEAYAKETKQKFISVCFRDMEKYYGNKTKTLYIYIVIYKILRKLHLVNYIDFNNEENIEIQQKKLSKRRFAFVCGWYFRRHDLTEKYRSFFQKKYSLDKQYVNNNQFIAKALLCKENEKIVGIHIRRGDYKDFMDGRFLFSDEVYCNAIKKMQKIMDEHNQKVKFILFSNEPLSFEENDKLLISHEEWYIDQYIMSKCDYLIGPPSTFTGWASYIGEVPVLYLESDDMDFSLKDFQIING